MKKKIYCIALLIICLQCKMWGQVLPKDYDTLNYRLVGFSVPENKQATDYLLEVHEYFPQDVGGYESKPLFEIKHPTHRIITTVPEFGKNYMWRIKYLKKKKSIDSTDYHFFSTGYSPVIDTNKYRLRIIDSAVENPGIYVMLDFISVIYDLQGNPLWYLPELPVETDINKQTRDLKPTQDGTFTTVSGLGAYEFDYNGNLIWKAPNDGKVSGEKSESYHHEFTKLSNGNYMVCGTKSTLKKLPAGPGLEELRKRKKVELHDDGNYYINVNTGTLIEYDSKGNVVWKWLSENYFSDDYFFKKKISGPGVHLGMHLNGFEFDEKNKVIYLSFRNTNQIVKIEYPSGKILQQYGQDIKDTSANEKLFYGQHCIRKSKDGKLYLFNNNTEEFNHGKADVESQKNVSYVSVFEESATAHGGIRKIWEFSCDIDSNASAGAGPGGSTYMLENGAILVGMGGVSRIFIVSPEKKIIWNAIPELSNDNMKTTHPMRQYRASYINTNELEKYIFSP
ncbi:MAG: aryl-sulfate sulfotransferase [Taibaiella sp.]|nr:aryl-sulfate sulfotransferase [Taibaiella sp.]